MSRPRLYVHGNAGGPCDFHLGDEARLEMTILRLRQLIPNVDLTVPSRDPQWTGARYAVDTLRIREHAGDDPEWIAPEIGMAVRDSDGLVICGNAEIARACPDKILERVALIEHAANLARPVVIFGQYFAPDLTSVQRKLLARALTRVQWIGVRDEPSAQLARSVGVAAERVHLQLDDAFFLEPIPITDERMETFGERRLIAVMLDPTFDRESIAPQLDALAGALDADLVFIPNHGWQSGEARWLVGKAAMVITSWQYGVVFATAAGVPSIGIYPDRPTRTKMRGTLRHADLEGWSLSVPDAVRGGLVLLALELWRNRDNVRQQLAELHGRVWREELRRWRGICSALELHCDGTLPSPHIGEAAIPEGVHLVNASIDDDVWHDYDHRGYMRLGRLLDRGQLDADVDLTNVLRGDFLREVCARHYGGHANISYAAADGTNAEWHQNLNGIGRLDRDPLVTLWIALDDTAIDVVPGSHRRGLLRSVENEVAGETTEHLEVAAGEAVLLHNWLIRRTAAAGRALAFCYMDARTWNVVTGERFPVIFGENQDPEATLPFLEAIRNDNQMLRDTAEQAAVYAQSLADDRESREQMRMEAERYARSLEEELGRLRNSLAQALLFAGVLPAAQFL